MSETLESAADLLREIEVFCETREMGVTTFGRSAIGDANLVANMRRGRSPTMKTADRVRQFMVTYDPEQAAV